MQNLRRSGTFMAFLLNKIYFSSPGTTKHNANKYCSYLSRHTSFPHGVKADAAPDVPNLIHLCSTLDRSDLRDGT